MAAAAEEEKTQTEGDAGPNKRSRAEETAQTPIDVTEDDGSVGGNTNDHINDMNMPDALSDDFSTKTDKVMAEHNKVVWGVVPDLGPYLESC